MDEKLFKKNKNKNTDAAQVVAGGVLLGFCALLVCAERGVAQRACPPQHPHASRTLGSTLVPAGPARSPTPPLFLLGPGDWTPSGWWDLEPAPGPRPRGRSRCVRPRPVAAACPLGPGPRLSSPPACLSRPSSGVAPAPAEGRPVSAAPGRAHCHTLRSGHGSGLGLSHRWSQ